MLLFLKTSSRKKSSKSSKSRKSRKPRKPRKYNKYGKGKGKTYKINSKNLNSISYSTLYKLLSKKKKGKGKTKHKYQNKHKPHFQHPEFQVGAPAFEIPAGHPPGVALPTFGAILPILAPTGQVPGAPLAHPAPALAQPIGAPPTTFALPFGAPPTFGAPPAIEPPHFESLPAPVQKKMNTLIRKSQQSRKSKKDLKGDLDSLIKKVRRVQNNKKVQHYKKKLDKCRLEHCSDIANREDMKNCENKNCHTELKKYNKRFQKEYTRNTE